MGMGLGVGLGMGVMRWVRLGVRRMWLRMRLRV